MTDPTLEKFTPEQIIAAIKEGKGFITASARILECSRRTIYNYRDRYPEIEAVLNEVRQDTQEHMVDIAENNLFHEVQAGNLTAIMFYLKCQAKDRGYTERYQLTGKDDEAIKHSVELTEIDRNISAKLEKLSKKFSIRGNS